METPLPCPFCGTENVKALPTGPYHDSVFCEECGSQGPSTRRAADLELDQRRRRAPAIAAWNCRSAPDGYWIAEGDLPTVVLGLRIAYEGLSLSAAGGDHYTYRNAFACKLIADAIERRHEGKEPEP